MVLDQSLEYVGRERQVLRWWLNNLRRFRYAVRGVRSGLRRFALVRSCLRVDVCTMNDSSQSFLPSGGYRNLISYKITLVIHEATIAFCERFYPRDYRQTSQMVQAARSGVRNISEGSGAAATSRQSEMHLTNVALASLADELLQDYETFLAHRGLGLWERDDPRTLDIRQRLRVDRIGTTATSTSMVECWGLHDLPRYVRYASPEDAANAMICAIHQATYLLRRQLRAQDAAFQKEGGFRENLFKRRREQRKRQPDASDRSDASDTSDRSDAR